MCRVVTRCGDDGFSERLDWSVLTGNKGPALEHTLTTSETPFCTNDFPFPGMGGCRMTALSEPAEGGIRDRANLNAPQS